MSGLVDSFFLAGAAGPSIRCEQLSFIKKSAYTRSQDFLTEYPRPSAHLFTNIPGLLNVTL